MSIDASKPKYWLLFYKILLCAAFLLIAAQLVRIQLVQSDEYARIAAQQHNSNRVVPAPRGRILDRNLRPLADSIDAESVWLYKPAVDEKKYDEIAVKLATVLDGKTADFYRMIVTGPKYVRIARHLDGETARKLRAANIPGIDFSHDPKRFYPNGRAACQLLGFCNGDGDGGEGIELQYNRYLKGKDGYVEMLRDATGKLISSPKESSVDPRKGYDIVTTLDLWIQNILEEELEKACEEFRPSGGVAAVMDVRTGEVLAMASWPFFDPNKYNLYPTANFRNRVISDIYEPGSMAKAFCAAGAIERGVMSPDTVIYCENGAYALHGRVIKDAGNHRYGNLTVGEVIAKSSNVGAAKIGEALGAQALYETLVNFGFTQKTELGLRGEQISWLYPPSKWSKKSVASISFGYEISVTPMALVRAYGAIATDGTLPDPSLVNYIVDSSGNKIPVHKDGRGRSRAISQETAEKMRKILRLVVTDGTCKNALNKDYAIAGKTGTAIKVVNGCYDWSKTLSSFIGFAPLQNPRIVVLVSLDEPKKAQYGGTVAGTAVREVVCRTLRYLGVPPDARALTD